MSATSAGLAGVVAGQTAIATVGQEGLALRYRGYSVNDLAAQSQFEEVAYLLLFGTLPTATQLDNFIKALHECRELPRALCTILEQIPAAAHPMDVLRTVCSVLGALEPAEDDQQTQNASRLLTIFPAALLYWYHFHQDGARIETTSKEVSHAGYFLDLLHRGHVDAKQRQAINTSFILYAEHEFNASTFAARVTTGTESDIYSAVCSAIGTLRGPLHGGANEKALDLIRQFSTPEEAEVGIRAMLKAKQKVMGFGHRVYQQGDPRHPIIKALALELSQGHNDEALFAVADRIEQVMLNEKDIYPNVDFFSALAYHYCDIPQSFFTPLFVMSRVTGWSAHIFEQCADNRLIRPSAEYIGPEPQQYLSLEQRS